MLDRTKFWLRGGGLRWWQTLETTTDEQGNILIPPDPGAQALGIELKNSVQPVMLIDSLRDNPFGIDSLGDGMGVPVVEQNPPPDPLPPAYGGHYNNGGLLARVLHNDVINVAQNTDHPRGYGMSPEMAAVGWEEDFEVLGIGLTFLMPTGQQLVVRAERIGFYDPAISGVGSGYYQDLFDTSTAITVPAFPSFAYLTPTNPSIVRWNETRTPGGDNAQFQIVWQRSAAPADPTQVRFVLALRGYPQQRPPSYPPQKVLNFPGAGRTYSTPSFG